MAVNISEFEKMSIADKGAHILSQLPSDSSTPPRGLDPYINSYFRELLRDPSSENLTALETMLSSYRTSHGGYFYLDNLYRMANSPAVDLEAMITRPASFPCLHHAALYQKMQKSIYLAHTEEEAFNSTLNSIGPDFPLKLLQDTLLDLERRISTGENRQRIPQYSRMAEKLKGKIVSSIKNQLYKAVEDKADVHSINVLCSDLSKLLPKGYERTNLKIVALDHVLRNEVYESPLLSHPEWTPLMAKLKPSLQVKWLKSLDSDRFDTKLYGDNDIAKNIATFVCEGANQKTISSSPMLRAARPQYDLKELSEYIESLSKIKKVNPNAMRVAKLLQKVLVHKELDNSIDMEAKLQEKLTPDDRNYMKGNVLELYYAKMIQPKTPSVEEGQGPVPKP